MTKTILITGSTDGIGYETAKALAALGHHIILHGRSTSKLEATEESLKQAVPEAKLSLQHADLSRLQDVRAMTAEIVAGYPPLDVVINNAGVFTTKQPISDDGLDVRFVVNTIAPYLITLELLPSMGPDARVLNLSSAAQAPVNVEALAGRARLDGQAAYAQSKLALTMWSIQLGLQTAATGPMITAINPGSLLATKMVKEGYGIQGSDVGIGAGILTQAALNQRFATASGTYFDNDSGDFADPHPDALDPDKRLALVLQIDEMLAKEK